MVETPNHYAVLGLTRSFDEQQLKRQYRLLALKYHPDRNRGDEDEAAAHFKLIAEAHRTLGDPKARRAYDLEQLKQMALNRRRPPPRGPTGQHAAPPPVPPPVAAAAAAAKALAAAQQQAAARQAARAAAAAQQPPPLPPSTRPSGGAASGDQPPPLPQPPARPSTEWDGMDAALEASVISQAEAQIANEEAEIAAAVQEVRSSYSYSSYSRTPTPAFPLLLLLLLSYS
eukprot:scaffold98643_cov56-Phaeocystis_antarctica.AAC.4